MDSSAFNRQFNLGKGRSFAAIRMSGSKLIYFIYSSGPATLNKVKAEAATSPKFYFSPYGAGALAYTISAETVYENERLILGEELKMIESEEMPLNLPFNKEASKESYISYVKQCVAAIRSKKLKKVVAARCEHQELSKSFEPSVLFQKLCEEYPSACVYFFSSPGSTSWIGATPEELLSIEKNTIRTVALAGTIPSTGDQEWGEKEKDEQRLTAEFIKGILKAKQCTPFKETPVKSLEAGQVQHLFASYTWSSDLPIVRAKFHKLLEVLNPTPAVCGLPAQEASSFIALQEEMERRFYSGFIGWDNGKGSINLYVNLRCMEYANRDALLYAGAGITADSNPEKEWDETIKKMQTLRNLI